MEEKIVKDPICPRCKMRAESTIHAVIECKAAKQMWKLTPFRDEAQLLRSPDLFGQMYEIAKRSKEELKLIVALWWVAWYVRNQFVFEMETLDPERAAAKAEAVGIYQS